MNRRADEWIEMAPPRRGLNVPFSELWRYRDVARYLVMRDLKLKYRQTVLGILWAIVQPLVGVLACVVIFRRISSDLGGAPSYVSLAFSGFVMWSYVSNVVTTASEAFVSNPALLTKVYTPRLLIPMASAIAPLADMGIGFVVLVAVTGSSGHAPSWRILAVPVVVAGTCVMCFGVGLLLATLNAEYRDVRHVYSVLVQAWLFLSPVAYSRSVVRGRLSFLYTLNPLVGLIDSFRWATVHADCGVPEVASAALVSSLVLVGSLIYFGRVERRLADVI
jgi:ABC-type polysaccharide/polyol phosphate export permease